MIAPFLPMLATAASPFDSFDYLFEVKWDGVRALAAVEGKGWRLWGRHLADYNHRYPELDVLRRLPSGTVVDGELVVLHEGRPDFPALLSRHHLLATDRIRQASRLQPVCYMLFDILYHQGRSLMDEPLYRRRGRLVDLLSPLEEPRLCFSEGVAGLGQDLFERVLAQGHEGVMAKHQASRYRPGQRSPAWRKIKPRHWLPCVIIGYTLGRHALSASRDVPASPGFHSLLVAAVEHGRLRYVGQVTSGFSELAKVDLAHRLARRRRSRPVVTCPRPAVWVEPELYCRVQFQERTAQGRLRGTCFRGLLGANA